MNRIIELLLRLLHRQTKPSLALHFAQAILALVDYYDTEQNTVIVEKVYRRGYVSAEEVHKRLAPIEAYKVELRGVIEAIAVGSW